MSWFNKNNLTTALETDFKRESKNIVTYGPKGGKDKDDLRKVYEAIQRGDIVIVRRYFQGWTGSKKPMEQYSHEANILGRFGYRPQGQVFNPTGALGGLIGAGEQTVTYVKG